MAPSNPEEFSPKRNSGNSKKSKNSKSSKNSKNYTNIMPPSNPKSIIETRLDYIEKSLENLSFIMGKKYIPFYQMEEEKVLSREQYP